MSKPIITLLIYILCDYLFIIVKVVVGLIIIVMMIGNRLFYNFALYFSKSLESTPILKAKQHLITFVQSRPPKHEF